MTPPRRATARDAAEIARLAGELGYPTTPEQAADRLAAVLADARHVVCVTGDPDRLAGWIHAAVQPSLDSDACVEILGLVVDGTTRGRGIGAALLAAVREWAAGTGLGELRVRSNVVRAGAHRFYEREGFVVKKTQKVFAQALRSDR